jgi:hypothetical protein
VLSLVFFLFRLRLLGLFYTGFLTSVISDFHALLISSRALRQTHKKRILLQKQKTLEKKIDDRETLSRSFLRRQYLKFMNQPRKALLSAVWILVYICFVDLLTF